MSLTALDGEVFLTFSNRNLNVTGHHKSKRHSKPRRFAPRISMSMLSDFPSSVNLSSVDLLDYPPAPVKVWRPIVDVDTESEYCDSDSTAFSDYSTIRRQFQRKAGGSYRKSALRRGPSRLSMGTSTKSKVRFAPETPKGDCHDTPRATVTSKPKVATSAPKCPFASSKSSVEPAPPKMHMTPRRKYESKKPLWVWNYEGKVVGVIYATLVVLTIVAEQRGDYKWVMRAICTIAALHLCSEWRNWWDMFAWRYARSHPSCISHSMRPAPGTCTPSRNKRFRELPMSPTFEEDTYVRGYTPRTPSMRKIIKTGKMPQYTVGCQLSHDQCPGTCMQTAQKPDMDHIYMPFSDYLWCSLFVLPAMELGVLIGGKTAVGILGIVWYRFKERMGWNPAYDEEKVKKVLVDTMLGLSLLVWTKREGNVLTWKIPSLTHINGENGNVIAGDMVLKVDCVTREYLGATWRKEKLSPAAALGLFNNAFAGHTHPLLHGYASWGVNLEADNWFIRRMSIITVKYNNIGVQAWPFMVGFLRFCGLTRTPLSKDNTRLTIHLNHNVPDHSSNMETLMHLPYVNFVYKVRRFFMKQYELYKGDFADIDPEALFVGTILHSIDHNIVAKNCSKVLLECMEHVEPKWMADVEWALYTCNLATDVPSFRPYENRFSHAPHPFYRRVFEYAQTVDAELASFMECCIAI